MTCQINSCKKKISCAIESPVFTWPSCGVCQRVKAAKKGTTARLCFQIEWKAEVWLTAFTDVMENLLAKARLSINDTSDKIQEALLTMENITLVIDSVTNFILEVKKNDALIICISTLYCVDLCSVTLVSFRHSKQKEMECFLSTKIASKEASAMH